MSRERCELADLRGRRATVMGLGLLGGGLGVARFLAEHGARVTATDLKTEQQLQKTIEQLNGLPIRYRLGGHVEEDFTEADLVVVNPSVKEDSPYLALARRHGVELETEINLFFKLCPARIIGVTGSVGKSTTTSMIGHVLEQSGRRTWVGGNIGRSLLLELDSIRPDDSVVLELSSFQLRRLDWIKRAPAISVVTNLYPNHLDNHPTLDEYAACKKRIVTNQHAGDVAVLNADDRIVRSWASECPGAVRYFGFNTESANGVYLEDNCLVLHAGGREEAICGAKDLPLPGKHNVANALACAAGCAAAGLSGRQIAAALKTVQPVEHRLEFVGEWRGVRYYNDSKATTPESTITALEAFEAPILLIAGGSSKEHSYGEFAPVAVRRARAVFLIGQTAPQMAEALERARSGRRPHVEILPTLEAALEAAARAATAGDVVLLSPTTASYDMFANFEQRGTRFKECVRALQQKPAASPSR